MPVFVSPMKPIVVPTGTPSEISNSRMYSAPALPVPNMSAVNTATRHTFNMLDVDVGVEPGAHEQHGRVLVDALLLYLAVIV